MKKWQLLEADLEIIVRNNMKCVYCGKEINDGGIEIKVSNGTFHVCSNECNKLTREYLNNDQKYKQRSYILIFFGAIGFLFSTFIMAGRYKLVPMYIGMIIMGLSLIIYPYVFTSFMTFNSYPIKKSTTLVKILGGIICMIAIVFLVLTFVLKVAYE